MANNDEQQTLDRLLDALKSDDEERCLGAIQELNTLRFSSPAILKELERLALHGPSPEIRVQANQSLGTSVHHFVRSNLNQLSSNDRKLLLKHIEQWERDGLLQADTANVLKQRYNFDAAALQAVPVKEVLPPSAPQVPLAPPAPVGPHPSLVQTLLSEASIKIYLYLGAFFVIASALILAALVQAARLPVLTVATLMFGGTALLLRKRLPQPSFALFIVFSFLLPIDANVLADTIGFTEPSLSVYWTIIFVIMTAIWGFSVWFYESRFFSAVAFLSLGLSFYRAGQIFKTEIELQVFLVMLASLLGLAGTFLLRKWKDSKFSLPVFWLTQLQVLGLLFLSVVLAAIRLFNADVPSQWWLLIALTWLAASVFYVLSDFLNPTFFFPWLAVAALLPLPWLSLNTLEVTEPTYALGFWGWGTVLAVGSEIAFRLPVAKIKRFHWAVLAGSAPLFLTSFFIALDWDTPRFTLLILALTALVYIALHMVRPRWVVWSAGLLGALCAYFVFFSLPGMQRLEFPVLYQVLLACVLFVTPELFSTSPLSLKSETRWPALAFGLFMSLFGIALALTDLDHTGRGALALILYSALFALHALHAKKEWLGYFSAATEILAVVYALNHFQLNLWLPALTLLAVIYYAAGFFFRRRSHELKAWGTVFTNSGLALGILLALTSLVLPREMSGWYVTIIALLFAVEVFARPFVWLELAVEILLSISLYQILHDFHITRIEHFLFGASLIWLGGDLIFSQLIQEKRMYRPIPLVVGFGSVVMSVFTLWSLFSPLASIIYFALYAVFFAVYALLQGESRLGYLTTAFLSLAIIKFCVAIDFEKWIFPLIGLAVFYYAIGYGLRQRNKVAGWNQMLVYSGLGLGVVTSLAAPLLGGLDASIPVAIAATLFAAEAFALRNVWWALPADGLYLMSYFMILLELNVDQPQYYSIGAALLGMLMHSLLTRANSKTGAWIAGMLSQFVLLGTTYLQMVSTENLLFFFVLFVQSLLVLIYGLIQRSRSLVITPIVFSVLAVMTVVYSALKGLGPVILIGSTGLVLLMAGIVAVLMRERITRLGEQLSDWKP